MKDLTKQIFESVHSTIQKKNHDYNNAFDKACERLGDTYAVGKIYEKTERIITLSQDEAMVEGEGLKDALEDCIGYCTLYLNRLANKELNANTQGKNRF